MTQSGPHPVKDLKGAAAEDLKRAAAEDLKRAAAEAAVAEIHSGMCVGLGTGSTVRWVLEALARDLRSGRLTGVLGVPTSHATDVLARNLEIPLTTLEDALQVDMAIDGADEIDLQLNLVKGGGGALLREKIVAHTAKEFVVVADAGKRVSQLLASFPLPVEVVPFGWSTHLEALAAQGAQVQRRMAGDHPFLTDNGNYVLDLRFAVPPIDLRALDGALRSMPGVVTSGLFLGMTSRAYVADAGGVQCLRPE